MKYFFDNNLSPKLARILHELGEDAVALRDEFDQSIKDVDLLKQLRGRGIVFVSADRKIRTSTFEAPLLKQANVTSLFIGPFWAKLKLWDQAEWIIKRWPMIRGFAEGAAKGTCAELKSNGKAMLFKL